MKSGLPPLVTIPAGPWAVAVSGGADSVALIHLLSAQAHLQLHVVHLNHETRAGASDADAAFVVALAARLGLRCTTARLSDIPLDPGATPGNPSARYRAARFAFFSRVVHQHALNGIILAHHADDQAETILHRLLRGNAPASLAGIRPDTLIGNLRVLHPLLNATHADLCAFLLANGHTWHEDESNASSQYERNRHRTFLRAQHSLVDPLLQLGMACARWGRWLDGASPHLPAQFSVTLLQDLAPPLALHAAHRWLIERGVTQETGPQTLHRLIDMARDAASPARQHFPGALLVRRRQGLIAAEPTGEEDKVTR